MIKYILFSITSSVFSVPFIRTKLRDHILTAVNKKFEDLKITRNGYINALGNETSRKNFKNICNNIKRQNQKLSSSIAERHRAKHLRDNITKFITINDTTENLGSRIEKDITERKLLHQENERKMIESIKATCPEQNAINLSTQELSIGENPYYVKAHSLFLIQHRYQLLIMNI